MASGGWVAGWVVPGTFYSHFVVNLQACKIGPSVAKIYSNNEAEKDLG